MEYIHVKIYPDNIEIKVKKGSKLIDVLYENNIHINTVCGGKGKCGKCKVKLLKGNLSCITDNELKLLTKEEINDNIVLACERFINESIAIELYSKELYTNKNSLNKGEIKEYKVDLNPIVNKKFIKLSKPTLIDPISDAERITREFKEELEIDVTLLPRLYHILIESNYEVTLTIYDKNIINIEKGNTTHSNYAIAIDLGTTTVGGYLIDLNTGIIVDSCSNSNYQQPYGGDVISRINYAMENSKNLSILRKLALKSIDEIIISLIESSKIDKKDVNILGIIGNTAMSHLLIGMSPCGIAKSPFNPVTTHLIKCNTDFLGISSLEPKNRCIILPNIGGYVGSDTLGVVISTDILNKPGNHLAIDIGTNCELVLKTNERILTCSTAAGPAFEGANMTQGMRAKEGAIYSCEIDDDIHIKTIGNKLEQGICGSGYIDIIAKLVDKGIIKKQGRIIDADKLDEEISEAIKSRIKKDENINRIVLSSNNKEEVSIYQMDIVNLQLAKGAVKSGIGIMMQEANVNTLDKIYLAGAFGSNLDKESLKKIKMIPNIEDNKIEVVGNAAASGLIKVLLSKDIYSNLIKTSKTIEHVELANQEAFQKEFVKSMMF